MTSPDRLSGERLDELWDFGDPLTSEQRFRQELLLFPADSVVAAELGTQLARAIGLQERYADADAVLNSIDNRDGVVRARVLLERGRLRNSGGHPELAVPLFEEALAAAAAEADEYLAVDAAHMLAIADAAHATQWTAHALETVAATKDSRTRRWAIALHNNLGSNLLTLGQATGALAEFELAADAAREFGTPQQQRWAQEAIDEALEALRD